MSGSRFQALETLIDRTPGEVKLPGERISEYFARDVFNEAAMKKFLSEEAYLGVKSAIYSGTKIDRKIADQVAASMKSWAISKGATHFTHWFQPLTGATAEKHDSFFSPFTTGSAGIESFSGDALVQQEPDASSFPSGGLRTTFEARGYTAWDPTSPSFIMERNSGKVLCIPTIFVSYTGEALDFKAPLLKSIHLVEKAAVPVCQLFDKNVTRVWPTLGWEQEYFLIDAALYNARPDLLLAGRTLIGHGPAKGQQLEDHYFGSIPERVLAFMVDMEKESHLLGIPVTTRHNEVAPAQFECAPRFEHVNLAVDHNQLIMDVMERVARRHKLRVLLHEKPFAGINGSGKHNNWSLATDTGVNLLSPGKTPKNNIQFLAFFVCTLKSVFDYNDLMRASIASAGNDHRLGANEAPPAIISAFIGKHLFDVLDEISEKVKHGKFDDQEKIDLKLNIHNMIPDLMLDNTDRNRTSPFAFTGNKFEVRAVGSSANCASVMTVLNTIMAETLFQFKKEVDELIQQGEKKDGAVLRVIRRYIEHSRNVIFEGDNYSEEWAQEAAKRGLSNVKDTPRALDFYLSPKAREVFIKNGIYTDSEIHARHEIHLESYIRKLQIEARLMGDLCLNHIIPAAVEYQNRLIENIRGLKEIGFKTESYAAQKEIAEAISGHISELKKNIDQMVEQRKKVNKIEDGREKAIAYCDKVKVFFEPIRYHADKLEQLVDDNLWPLPKYRELLFLR